MKMVILLSLLSITAFANDNKCEGPYDVRIGNLDVMTYQEEIDCFLPMSFTRNLSLEEARAVKAVALEKESAIFGLSPWLNETSRKYCLEKYGETISMPIKIADIVGHDAERGFDCTIE